MNNKNYKDDKIGKGRSHGRGCGDRPGRRCDRKQGADSHLVTKVTETNALEMSPLC